MTTASDSAHGHFVYIGTYTQASKGVYRAAFDPQTGRLGDPVLAGEMPNPSFLTVSFNRKFLYAVSESSQTMHAGKPGGSVNAYAISPADATLTAINSVASAGRDPCHLAMTPDGRAILVANYSSGTVALLPVQNNGALCPPSVVDQHEGKSIHPSRQKGPYAHSVTLTADGRLVFAANLGTDKIYIYHVDTIATTLTPASPHFVAMEPGSGPRHLALTPAGNHIYVINELANTLTTFALQNETGGLKALQTLSTLPIDFMGNNTAGGIAVHLSGRFVYASNRGHDSIGLFRIDAKTGTLKIIEHVPTQGRTPRHFAIDSSGRWLIVANQESDSLVVYTLDPASGRLTPTGQKLTVNAPACVCFY